MRAKQITLFAIVCLLPALARAAPEDGAVEQYRAYVTAVRAGKLDDVVKLVEPVPETSKALLNARLKQAIAVEAMKKEMISQFGPAKTGDDAWNIGGLPYDDAMKNLKGVAQGADTVALMVTEPQGVAGWMIRKNGKWVIPAGLVMDLEPAPQFVEPEAGERDEKIKYADATTKAADGVLQRLKKKEFKKPAEVLQALGAEMQKASGK